MVAQSVSMFGGGASPIVRADATARIDRLARAYRAAVQDGICEGLAIDQAHAQARCQELLRDARSLGLAAGLTVAEIRDRLARWA